MKIHLILPALKERFSQPYRRIKYSLFPPLSLMTIAGLTPPEHEVVISDEHVADLDVSDSPDLVGMTAYISSSHRAYRIADEYRSRGVPVVLGGIHPTTLPAEAKAHCDAVVIGEAEGVWRNLLADLQAGRLQPFYDRWGSILARSTNFALAGTLKRILINVGYKKMDLVWDPMIKRHLVGMGLPVLERVLDMEFRHKTKGPIRTEGTHQPLEALIGGEKV